MVSKSQVSRLTAQITDPEELKRVLEEMGGNREEQAMNPELTNEELEILEALRTSASRLIERINKALANRKNLPLANFHMSAMRELISDLSEDMALLHVKGMEAQARQRSGKG